MRQCLAITNPIPLQHSGAGMPSHSQRHAQVPLLPRGNHKIRSLDGSATPSRGFRETPTPATESKADENARKTNILQFLRHLDAGEEPSHSRRIIESTSVRPLRHDVRARFDASFMYGRNRRPKIHGNYELHQSRQAHQHARERFQCTQVQENNRLAMHRNVSRGGSACAGQ